MKHIQTALALIQTSNLAHRSCCFYLVVILSFSCSRNTSVVIVGNSPIVCDTGSVPNSQNQNIPIITKYFLVGKKDADDASLERAIDSFARPLLQQNFPSPRFLLCFYEQTSGLNKKEILSWPASERSRQFDYNEKLLIVSYQFGYNHEGKSSVAKYFGVKYLK